MRVRTRSACVVLAWGILLLLLLTAGSTGSPRHTQANNRTAGTTSNTTQTTHTQATLTDSPAQAAPAQATLTTTAQAAPAQASRTDAATASPAAHPAPQRYVVQPGDTLTGIAAALGTPGGWPALYAANRQAIGPDPDLVQAGTVLTIPHPAPPAPAPAPPAPHPAPAPAQPPTGTQPPAPAKAPATAPAPAQPPASAKAPATAPAAAPTQPAATQPGASARPRTAAKTPAMAGLPRWLQIVLLAAGVLIATAFLTELILGIGRRRRRATQLAAQPAAYPRGTPAACPPTPDPRILLADYDRLIVTSSGPDGTVCVLRPPGADPKIILLAARLVLPQDRYEQLAGHLGMTAHGRRE